MAINSDDKRGILNELMVKQNCKCYYCGAVCFIGTKDERINKDTFPDIATIEHLMPPGMPERNHKENLVMACNKCNNGLSHRRWHHVDGMVKK